MKILMQDYGLAYDPIFDATVGLSRQFHRLRGFGVHTGIGEGSGGAWNNHWRKWLQDFKNDERTPHIDDVYDEFYKLVDAFGLQHAF